MNSKCLFVEQMLDVLASAGKEIIDADHGRPFGQQRLAQMRAKKARPAGDHDARVEMHGMSLPRAPYN